MCPKALGCIPSTVPWHRLPSNTPRVSWTSMYSHHVYGGSSVPVSTATRVPSRARGQQVMKTFKMKLGSKPRSNRYVCTVQLLLCKLTPRGPDVSQRCSGSPPPAPGWQPHRQGPRTRKLFERCKSPASNLTEPGTCEDQHPDLPVPPWPRRHHPRSGSPEAGPRQTRARPPATTKHVPWISLDFIGKTWIGSDRVDRPKSVPKHRTRRHASAPRGAPRRP